MRFTSILITLLAGSVAAAGGWSGNKQVSEADSDLVQKFVDWEDMVKAQANIHIDQIKPVSF